jgi:hypothetical protein
VRGKPVALVAVGGPAEQLEAEMSGGSRYNTREAKKVSGVEPAAKRRPGARVKSRTHVLIELIRVSRSRGP